MQFQRLENEDVKILRDRLPGSVLVLDFELHDRTMTDDQIDNPDGIHKLLHKNSQKLIARFLDR